MDCLALVCAIDDMEEKTIIKLSVRNLVEFILRSGSLDNRVGSGTDREAMQKGSRLHRKIQKQMKASYRPEVPLTFEKEYEEFIIKLEGRADGICEEENEVMIDEIKGVYLDLSLLTAPVEVHRAQAMCYGYIYGSQRGLEAVTIQMTYCHLESENIKRFQEKISLRELTEWFEALLEQYYKWADFQYRRKKIRRESMEHLEFPFPYREGQRELVAGVYRTIHHKRQLFIQAPTGVGKTMSAIFPAVRAVGEGHGDKIFYLTAKTITRTVAEEAFAILKEHGLSYKTITITAKEKLCLCEEMNCNPEHCPYADGHFDRVNDAVFALLGEDKPYSREVLEEHAERWKVCPYEMCLDTASWVDGIICDYNYVFDPNVHLRRFFGEGMKGDYLFLIDEAHNLVERGRKMYSACLYKEDFLEAKRIVKGQGKKLERLLGKCSKELLEYKKECETCEVLPNLGTFPISLMNLLGEMENFLEEAHKEEISRAVLELSFQVRHFLNMYDLLDENYVIYCERKQERFSVNLFCVNPAANLQNCLNKGNSAVFFSATLLPLAYYRSLFSTREDDYAMYAKSPFEREHLCLLLGRDVSSRYVRRGYEEYRKIAAYISCLVRGREGNYMVFFPSYRMMEDVYDIFREEFALESCRCILQDTAMNEKEREEFLEEFSPGKTGTLVGFCVLGGVFAEGIDLYGERLIGAVIVGTGLPQVSNEREILKQFYDKRGINGFDYAYRYPGMNKVLQSAGRVIRTSEDRGIVLLLDERFLQSEYRQLFPPEWEGYQVCALSGVKQEIQKFWSIYKNFS
ncbi:ATP-dependent DNA helicase [Lactonifactor longoviformis]|uniref:DNA 5'-3' helicase n=2 Tax=Lactonifactor TaxID=420345 RepID=A0A1M5AZE2_9CLOT|nr:ATP-dependent DNA helicase [Lactonifactor longoviformis]SHF35661.1 Rad3-related DNA helicase [Lactonifactor longoviformis DSM 17459]